MLTGENGVLTKATEAKEKTMEEQVKEGIELMSTEYTGGKYIGEEKDIKKFYQQKASKGEISSIKDNGDETYTIHKDGYEVKIDKEGSVIEIQEKKEVAVTEIWYKIDGTTLHLSNSDLGGYLKHNESLEEPEWLEGTTNLIPSPITKVIFDNNVAPISTEKWFKWCGNLTEIENIEYLNTSNVLNMASMFQACNKLQYVDVSEFDTSNVTNMYAMFYFCNKINNIDVSGFDTSKVTRIGEMFSFCYELRSIDVSGFNTKNLNDRYAISGMFAYCESLENVDVSNFDTSKVTHMNDMFNHCTNLTNLDLSNFNTSNVTDMGNMFAGCTALTKLDLSNFNTSKVNRMVVMFDGCTSLNYLNLTNFDTKNISDCRWMFRNVLPTAEIYVGTKWTLEAENVGFTGKFLVGDNLK